MHNIFAQQSANNTLSHKFKSETCRSSHMNPDTLIFMSIKTSTNWEAWITCCMEKTANMLSGLTATGPEAPVCSNFIATCPTLN